MCEIKAGKYFELKGIIGASTGIFIIILYLIYNYYYYYNEVKLNELYFISSGVGVSICMGLLFTFFQNIYIKTILLFTSVFYFMLILIYIVFWVILGEPYTHIKAALIIGLLIGIIYVIYDNTTNKRTNNANKPADFNNSSIIHN